MTDLSEPQRQSPWAVIFLGFKIVRSIGIVQVAVAFAFVVTRGLDGRLLLLLPLAAALLIGTALLSWWRFTFQLVGGEFVVRSGVVRIDRLSVPVQRIQSISVEQELLHRVVGVVKVSLDTAGSDAAEFRIDAVSADVAEELRRVVGRAATVVDHIADGDLGSSEHRAPAQLLAHPPPDASCSPP